MAAVCGNSFLYMSSIIFLGIALVISVYGVSYILLAGNEIREMSSYKNNIEFTRLYREAQEAVQAGINPELTPEGASGSYFVKNKNGKTIGVFKPRSEEMYRRRFLVRTFIQNFFQRALKRRHFEIYEHSSF